MQTYFKVTLEIEARPKTKLEAKRTLVLNRIHYLFRLQETDLQSRFENLLFTIYGRQHHVS